MGVMLELSCGGCDATARVGPLRRELRSIYGGSLHVSERPDPEALTPPGWVMFDPYTRCTYCPDCWAQIKSGVPATAPADELPEGDEGDEGRTFRTVAFAIRQVARSAPSRDLAAVRENLNAIIIGCREGNKWADWLPIVDQLATEALAALGDTPDPEPAECDWTAKHMRQTGHCCFSGCDLRACGHCIREMCGCTVVAVQPTECEHPRANWLGECRLCNADLAVQPTEEPDPADDPLADIMNAPVRFWTCPDSTHKRVEWRGDVAHCLVCDATSRPAPATPEATNG